MGKGSLAYLTARALLCTGNDPLGCGQCPSCKSIAESGIGQHKDLIEIAAASHPDVEFARTLLEEASLSPVLGARKVILIDECHRLFRETWDVYLKPLDLASESKDSKLPIFILVSNDEEAIPKNIKSRCAIVRFKKVATETVVGLLSNLCNRNKIKYELDGLKAIAHLAQGHVRDAVTSLNTVASIGDVTKSLVVATLDATLDDYCLKIFNAIGAKDLVKASQVCDEACNDHLPNKLIDGMFSLYAKAQFSGAPEMEKIQKTFPNVADVSATFLRWTNTQYLSADALPLLMVELIDLIGATGSAISRTASSSPIVRSGKGVSALELLEIVNGVDVTNLST